MSLQSVLDGVRSELQTELGIDFVDGYVEGPLEVELGCVWPEETAEDEDRAWLELLDIRVRVYKPAALEYTPDQPAENSELVDVRERIIVALKDKQAKGFGSWFFRIRGFDFDAAARSVEARLTAWHENPFAAQ